MYLSKQIEAMSQRKKNSSASLVRRNYSSGIFQDYTQIVQSESRATAQEKLHFID